MALNLNAEPPQWLTRQAEWARGVGERGLDQFIKGANFFANQKAQQLNMASQALGIEAQQQALDMNAIMLQNKAKDMGTIPVWMRKNDTPEKRREANWPTAFSPEGEKILESVRIRDAQSTNTKAATEDISLFSSKMSTIDPADRAAIRNMQPNRDGTPSKMQWDALSLAEQSQKSRIEVEAARRGDAVTTTVTDKGVTQTYKPAPIGGTGVMPKEVVLSDGSKVVVNPKTGSFKFMSKDGKEKDFTKPQLLAIAKHLQSVDADDENAKRIIEFLAEGAVKQAGGTQGPQFFKNLREKATGSTYANEQSARSGGKKAGDVVTLEGVGKVRLK